MVLDACKFGHQGCLQGSQNAVHPAVILCYVKCPVWIQIEWNFFFQCNRVKKCTGPEHMIFQFKLRTIIFAFLFERELLKF